MKTIIIIACFMPIVAYSQNSFQNNIKQVGTINIYGKAVNNIENLNVTINHNVKPTALIDSQSISVRKDTNGVYRYVVCFNPSIKGMPIFGMHLLFRSTKKIKDAFTAMRMAQGFQEVLHSDRYAYEIMADQVMGGEMCVHLSSIEKMQVEIFSVED